MMKAIEQNHRIKAMVVDIDSPGGSAGASEFMHNSIARVAKRKPVVAVRGMGASGRTWRHAGRRASGVPMAPGDEGDDAVMLYDALDRIACE
jgi:hypothetical protein